MNPAAEPATPPLRPLLAQREFAALWWGQLISILGDRLTYLALLGLIAEHTGQTVEQIEADSDRDRWFTAAEALDYGFIDHVYARAAQIATESPNQ